METLRLFGRKKAKEGGKKRRRKEVWKRKKKITYMSFIIGTLKIKQHWNCENEDMENDIKAICLQKEIRGISHKNIVFKAKSFKKLEIIIPHSYT